MLFGYCATAQREQDIIRHIENADSEERIRSVCMLYDDIVTFGETSEKFDIVLAECYRIAKKDNDTKFKEYLDFYKRARAVMLISDSNLYVRKAKMLKIWEEISEHYRSAGNEYFMAICDTYLGHFYFMQKEYDKSIEKLLVADEGFKKTGYDKFPDIGKHLHSIALIFYFFRQYEKVAELMEISVRLHPYRENYHIQRYNTLGAAYTHLKKYKKAESAFEKTVETAASYKDSLWIAIASRGLGKVYLYEEKYTEALDLYKSTLKYIKKTDNAQSKEYSGHLLGLAKACVFVNNLPKARKYLDGINYTTASGTEEPLFNFGVSYQDVNYLLDFYEVQHRYYFALKEYKKAYFYADSLYAIKYKIDSTFNWLGIQVAQNRIEAQYKQYENEKKEAVIKSKNQQMFFISSLLAVIAMTTLLIIRKNREISRKNKIINKQLAELSKTLEQKQMLLSELQHRVKNNLQHVISILEIQKESVDFNNIDELIRGNQNRIRSMALLHKKLDTAESVNEVDLKRYVTELSELVKESYDSHKKKISIDIQCDTETISIEKALPLGLIIVELVSNSMKHAFKNRSIGIINIEITKDQYSNKLYYADNGTGFDFNSTSEKGLGQEIIKGLIDQLDGTTETNSNNGFELKIYFN